MVPLCAQDTDKLRLVVHPSLAWTSLSYRKLCAKTYIKLTLAIHEGTFPAWLMWWILKLPNTSAFSILADASHLKGAGGKVTFLLKENVMGGFCHSVVRVNYFWMTAARTSEALPRTMSTSPSGWPPARGPRKGPATPGSPAPLTGTARAARSCAGTSPRGGPWRGRSPRAGCWAPAGSAPQDGSSRTAAEGGYLWVGPELLLLKSIR